MKPTPKFSGIVATLLRPSYASLVAAIRRQTFMDGELLARADPGNEYIARNRAAMTARGGWLVFMDDDAVPSPGYLAHLAAVVTKRPELVAVSGALRGNLWGQGLTVVDQPGWWIGAVLAARRDVFLERPFEETWGLGRIPRGWRADTDWGFSIEERYPGRWLHDGGWVMDHPGKMQSVWDPEVEDVFFRRWREQYIERFIPVDPRGQQFLLETQILTADEKEKVLKARKELRKSMPQLPVLPEEA